MRPRLNQKPYYTHVDKNDPYFTWEADEERTEITYYPESVYDHRLTEIVTSPDGLPLNNGKLLNGDDMDGQVSGKETLDTIGFRVGFYEGTLDREIEWHYGNNFAPVHTLRFEGYVR